MDETIGVADELIVEACGLLEEADRTGWRDERLAARAALLRDDLLTALACADVGAHSGDAAGAAVELEAVLARLDRLPPDVPALTG